MFFWRLLSVGFLIVGLFLFGQSLFEQTIGLFYFAIASYAVASLMWLTIQKLYIESFNYKKSCRQNQHSWVLWQDIANMVDVILSLPKILFLFLIHVIYD